MPVGFLQSRRRFDVTHESSHGLDSHRMQINKKNGTSIYLLFSIFPPKKGDGSDRKKDVKCKTVR